MKLRIDAYRFAFERTVGFFISRERLGGRNVYSFGVNYGPGCVSATVRS